MQISVRTAMSIVEEISGIIGQKINVMDENGIIIASSDVSRVGTFHEAAKKLIDSGEQEISVRYDHEYKGSLAGTNIAVIFQEKIVGVVGVTGPYQEVIKYGQIIRKMTEILLRDEYYREQIDIDERIYTRFLNEWLRGDPKNVNRHLAEQGLAIGIDISLPRRVLAASVILREKEDPARGQRIIDRAQKIVRRMIEQEPGGAVYVSGSNMLCVVSQRTDTAMLGLAAKVRNTAEFRYPIVLAVGIDSRTDGYEFIRTACLKAEKALRTCLRSPGKETRLYDSINMEIFSDELPDLTKAEYIHRIFRGAPDEDVALCIVMLEVFYEEEGSLSRAAERLSIHKNTLQYRLKKLKDSTGYDPRSIRYSSLFYNAIHFYHDIYDRD